MPPSTAPGSPWRIRTALAPAWSTDWISPAGRARLRDFGIAPPGACGGQEGARPGPALRAGRRRRERRWPPRCGSLHTQELARFASTACKALYRCLDCREPFDYFKPY